MICAVPASYWLSPIAPSISFSMASWMTPKGNRNHSRGVTSKPKRSFNSRSRRALAKNLCSSASSRFRLMFASLPPAESPGRDVRRPVRHARGSLPTARRIFHDVTLRLPDERTIPHEEDARGRDERAIPHDEPARGRDEWLHGSHETPAERRAREAFSNKIPFW